MEGKAKSRAKGKAKAFIIEAQPQWYLLVDNLEGHAPMPTASQLADLQTKAASLHVQALAAHSDVGTESSSKDGTFLQKVLQGGTLSDRLSALTLLVQGSPLHNTKALESLKGLAERGRGKGGRDESLKAVRAISDWWIGGGAPMRKLHYFRDQPLLHPNVTDRHLAVWYFEDWLKKYFFSLLHVLETLSMDPLLYVRTQSITFIFNLLKDRPEQEQNLLRLLVNKLGDHERTICSRVSYYLLQLMQAHPSMKSVVVREITALALKPPSSSSAATTATGTPKHIRFDDNGKKAKSAPEKTKPILTNTHAAYYATITFNQIVLSPSAADQQVARTLIDVYFTFFRDILGVMERSGVQVEENEDEDESAPKKSGKAHTKVKSVPGSTFLEVEDSTSRHVSAILTGVNRALPFAKLTLDDVNFSKHVDTLFLITHQSTFNISLQAMLLLQQITASSLQAKTGNAIIDRYYRTLYASLHDSRLATSNKHAMYLNLLFKSIKVDPSSERVVAFVRRFLQVLAAGGGGGPEFTAGGLFLIGELFSTVKDLRQQVSLPVTTSDASIFYDARKRDPLFAQASSSPMWELNPLLHHYHPAVALHARQLLSGQPVTATPDLALNTLSHFLDRFIYKKPKQAKPKGASIMQPAASANASGTAEGVRRLRGDAADLEGLMNDPKLLKRRVEDVPVDQVFFHKYFVNRKEKERARGGKKGGVGSDEEGDEDEESEEEAGDDSDPASEHDAPATSDDEEEAEIWKAMKATMPKVDGDDDIIGASDVDQDDDSEDGGFDFGSDDDSGDDNHDSPGSTRDVSESDDEQDDVGDEEDDGELAEGSDADDLLDLDADVPVDLIPVEDGASEDESEGGEWGGVETKSRKRTAKDDDRRVKKRKLRSLPTFASVEDYAALIDASPEDNI